MANFLAFKSHVGASKIVYNCIFGVFTKEFWLVRRIWRKKVRIGFGRLRVWDFSESGRAEMDEIWDVDLNPNGYQVSVRAGVG